MTQTDAPERIWLAPDDMAFQNDWGAVAQDKGIRLYWEGETQHNPEDDETPYIRADIAESENAALRAQLAAAREVMRGIEIRSQFFSQPGCSETASRYAHQDNVQSLRAALVEGGS